MKSDLHIHTEHSDGTATIDDIIDIINLENPTIIALTDHDSVAGIREINQKKSKITSDTKIINGVEITCTYYYNNKALSVHILGYGFDLENEQLNKLLEKNRIVRSSNLKKAIDNYYEEGHIKSNYDEIKSMNPNIDGLHMPHIYKSLHTDELTYEKVEAFKSNLKFERMEYASVDEAISSIKEAGGIVILAHPKRTCKGSEDIFNELISKEFDGIEVFYPNHEPKDILKLLRIIKKNDLIMTGGTDWHGDYTPSYWAKMGEFGLSDSETFIKKLERRNRVK